MTTTLQLSLNDAARIISDAGRGAYTRDEVKASADDARAAVRVAFQHASPDHPHGSTATFTRVTAARAVLVAHHGPLL